MLDARPARAAGMEMIPETRAGLQRRVNDPFEGGIIGWQTHSTAGGILDRWRPVLKVAAIVASAVAGVIALPPLALFAVFLIFVKALRETPPEPVRAPLSFGTLESDTDELMAGGDPVPVSLTYTVGPEGIAEGGGIRLCPGQVMRLSPGAWQGQRVGQPPAQGPREAELFRGRSDPGRG